MSRPHLAAVLCGLGLGATLHGTGFSDYRQLHAMFVFADPRLYGTYAGAVVLVALGFRLLPGGSRPPRPWHPGVIPGATLFGIGWVLSGACPVIPLVQLGEGKLPGLLVLAGVLVGVAFGEALHGRLLRYPRGGCGD